MHLSAIIQVYRPKCRWAQVFRFYHRDKQIPISTNSPWWFCRFQSWSTFVSVPSLLSISSLFLNSFCLSLSICYSLCSDEMQRDCELGIKECSLRMRDEKRRIIKWERKSVGLLVWCPEVTDVQNKGGQEKERKKFSWVIMWVVQCVYNREKTRVR